MSVVVVNVILLCLLVVAAIAINQQRNLFAAAMLTGIYSLLCASLFVCLDAVDVAFTEAAVGAGVATILFLGTLSLTGFEEKGGESFYSGLMYRFNYRRFANLWFARYSCLR